MSDAHKITETSILTKLTEPLVGIFQVNTTDSEIRFEITEDLAHKICTDLERFLTRRIRKSISDQAGTLDHDRNN